MMAFYKVSLLPVVDREDKYSLLGVITHDDILRARRNYLEKRNAYTRYIKLQNLRDNKKKNNVSTSGPDSE